MQRDAARRLLGVPIGAPAADVERAFRLQARGAHPDHGGDADRFRALAEARAVLLRPPPLPSRPAASGRGMAYAAGAQVARTRLVVRRSLARRVLRAWSSRFSSSPPRVS